MTAAFFTIAMIRPKLAYRAVVGSLTYFPEDNALIINFCLMIPNLPPSMAAFGGDFQGSTLK